MPIKKSEKGFGLVEVLIASSIFAVFIAVYTMTVSNNYRESRFFKQDEKLSDLAEYVLEEVQMTLPPQSKRTEKYIEDKNFEFNDQYSYSVSFKKFEIPSFKEFMGKEEGPQKEESSSEKMIFDIIKKNISQMVWQLEVKVISKEDKQSYSIATWVYDKDYQVKIGL